MQARGICNCIVETRQYIVISVQYVNQMPAAMLNACIEVSDGSLILGLAHERDAARAYLPYSIFRVIQRRAVIHYLDLHQLFARILIQNAFKRPSQIICTVESRNHHRPKRPLDTRRDRLNRRGSHLLSSGLGKHWLAIGHGGQCCQRSKGQGCFWELAWLASNAVISGRPFTRRSTISTPCMKE